MGAGLAAVRMLWAQKGLVCGLGFAIWSAWLVCHVEVRAKVGRAEVVK